MFIELTLYNSFLTFDNPEVKAYRSIVCKGENESVFSLFHHVLYPMKDKN